MSATHGIDNEDPLLYFEPLDSLTDFGSPSTSTLEGMDDERAMESSSSMQKGKEKATSLPMPIMISHSDTQTFDEFGVSPPWSTSSSYYDPPADTPIASSPSPSSMSFTLGSFTASWQMSTASEFKEGPSMMYEKWKGKERATELEGIAPPSTSPLVFTNNSFDGAQRDISLPSPSPSAGVSSSSSVPVSRTAHEPFTTLIRPPERSAAAGNEGTVTASAPKPLKPSRRHSYPHSNPNIRRPVATSSMARLKAKLGSSNKIHSNLARKLLSRKAPEPSGFITQIGKNSIKTPTDRVENVALEMDKTLVAADMQPFIFAPVPQSPFSLKTKGRSLSSPYPLSVLDIIPVTSQDIFVPIPMVVRNYFDEMLPRELKLHILASLVSLHENDHMGTIERGEWTALKSASAKNRWIGKDRAIRELVKFSRVSKSWQMLIFDGQLWSQLNLHSFPVMPKSLLSRLANAGGRFTTSLELPGHTHINSVALLDATDKLSAPLEDSPSITSFTGQPYTRLTTVNLRGCTSINTRSLHHLLVRSPFLEKLCVRGLTVVTNTTCDILGMYNSQITSLDMGRCPNMDAEGIRRLAAAAIGRGEAMPLKELRVGGLRNVTDGMMATLGKATPFLEVLDLSYSKQLHNSAVEAFVLCDDANDVREEYYGCKTITVNQDTRDGPRVMKRVTGLRHLNLSCCPLLTDNACTMLVGTLPKLEYLEMAGIGEDLKDDGLVKLLETTPMIRKLDLEDACDITDKVLEALTPSVRDPLLSGEERNGSLIIESGHALEELVISWAANLTESALIDLIRSCPRLTKVEADNTRMGSAVVKEFVGTSRKRQTVNAKLGVVDCRLVGDHVIKELSTEIRPRMGWRGWEARKLKYLDGRDFGCRPEWEVKAGMREEKEKDPDKEAIMKVAQGQDELDERRVVVKLYSTWQIVWSTREKRRKDSLKKKAIIESEDSEVDVFGSRGIDGSGRSSVRWWAPGGRRSRPGSGTNSPSPFEMNTNDGCAIM
ncbi:f-box domain-containing protein [Moniliophthora roreri]|uniref:F-box domain-containing protein n=1 Tax=Moniliophthora roreri TaxID=221103 RepID=A0A0W0FMF4_MONRR|nr:f-box domain-containing protein [Moniliophthora roreri]